jgi:hypothetical protein
MTMLARHRAFNVFTPIRSRAVANRVIGDASLVFFVIASLQALAVTLVGPTSLLLAVLLAGGAMGLLHHRSRGAALGLLALSVVMLAASLLGKPGDVAGTIANTAIATVLVWAAARALEATVKLRGRLAPHSGPKAGA